MNGKNMIHMLSSDGGAQMNSFIIETAEGGLIVIDGGYGSDADKLLKNLRRYGGSDRPRVDAWFLSHVHDDHIGAFMEIMRGKMDSVDVGKVYYCFPSEQFCRRCEPSDAHTAREFYECLPLFADRAVIVTAGDRYEISGAAFDILYTPDPAFTMNAINNSSVVMAMSLGGKRTLFTGDAGVEAGQKLVKQYGASLKSDICQMAHHGQNGADRDFYAAVRPETCLWCTPGWLWDNDAGRGYDTHTWKTVEVRGWMRELGAKRDYAVKDGDQHIVIL